MRFAFTLLATLILTGCDQIGQKLGLEDPAKKEAKAEAEGKAAGSACRHSGRAIEDCYSIYSWLPKSPILEGWREMDAYMRDNKIDTVAPLLPPPEPPGKKKKKPADENGTPEIKIDKSSDKPLDADKKDTEKPVEKDGDKNAGKPAGKGDAKL